jgi:hypothetical protein
MRKKIYFVVQGLFLKSDSIGYDCVFQYELLKEHFGDRCEIRIFAERFDDERYPGIPAEPVNDLLNELADLPDVTLVYHFCEGWIRLQQKLQEFRGELIVRCTTIHRLGFLLPPNLFTPPTNRSVVSTPFWSWQG